jgi:folate-binding protein YgfZ
MTTQSEGPFASARAAREAVLAVPAADRAAILVRGKERLTWLNGLVTCDLAKLGSGQGAYGLIVEKKGRIQTDFYALPSVGEAEPSLALAVLASTRDAMLETLDHYLVMEDAELELADLTFWQLHGPKARELIDGLEGTSYGGTLDLLGVGGAVVAVPAAHAAAYESRLEAGARALGGALASEEAWEAVRVEHGLPRFGVEADGSLYPQEASLEKLAVSFEKGCYLGQEVVYMLENRGHVKRKLVSLEVDGALPLGKGDAVTTPDGAAVGDVKSSLIGPSGKPVAIAMVKWAQSRPGTELMVDGRAVRVRASGPA